MKEKETKNQAERKIFAAVYNGSETAAIISKKIPKQFRKSVSQNLYKLFKKNILTRFKGENDKVFHYQVTKGGLFEMMDGGDFMKHWARLSKHVGFAFEAKKDPSKNEKETKDSFTDEQKKQIEEMVVSQLENYKNLLSSKSYKNSKEVKELQKQDKLLKKIDKLIDEKMSSLPEDLYEKESDGSFKKYFVTDKYLVISRKMREEEIKQS